MLGQVKLEGLAPGHGRRQLSPCGSEPAGLRVNRLCLGFSYLKEDSVKGIRPLEPS